MAIDIIRGTDKEFSIRIVKKSNEEPYNLTGLTGTDLVLKFETDDAPLELSLTANDNDSVLAIASALGGKITVTLSDTDTALLKVGSAQSMELIISEGAGPDFDVSIVQFEGQLNVIEQLFAEA